VSARLHTRTCVIILLLLGVQGCSLSHERARRLDSSPDAGATTGTADAGQGDAGRAPMDGGRDAAVAISADAAGIPDAQLDAEPSPPPLLTFDRQLTPDGPAALYVAAANDLEHALRLDPGGEPRQAINAAPIRQGPDGRTALFRADAPESTVYLGYLDGEALDLLALNESENSHGYAYSSDGKQLAYLDDQLQIQLLDLSDAQPTQRTLVPEFRAGRYDYLQWSPADDALLVIAQSTPPSHLIELGSPGMPDVLEEIGEANRIVPVWFSEDGSWLYHWTAGGTGGRFVPRGAGAAHGVSGTAAIDVGERIYLTRRRPSPGLFDYSAMNLDGTGVTQLSRPSDAYVAMRRCGRKLMFLRAAGGFDFAEDASSGLVGPAPLVGGTLRPHSYRFTPDCSRFVWLAERDDGVTELGVVDANAIATASVRTHALDTRRALDVGLAPDGQTLALHLTLGPNAPRGDLKLIHLGPVLKEIAALAFEDMPLFAGLGPKFSEDSILFSAIARAEAPGYYYLHRVRLNGDAATSVTPVCVAVSPAEDPRMARDASGKRVLLVHDPRWLDPAGTPFPGALYECDLETGVTRVVAEPVAAYPHARADTFSDANRQRIAWSTDQRAPSFIEPYTSTLEGVGPSTALAFDGVQNALLARPTTFSRSGDWVAGTLAHQHYPAGSAGVWVADVMRGAPGARRYSEAQGQPAMFSRDETELVSVTYDAIWGLDLASGTERLLARTSWDLVATLVLRGGRGLLFTDEAGVLSWLDDTLQLTALSEQRVISLRVSADESWIMYLEDDQSTSTQRCHAFGFAQRKGGLVRELVTSPGVSMRFAHFDDGVSIHLSVGRACAGPSPGSPCADIYRVTRDDPEHPVPVLALHDSEVRLTQIAPDSSFAIVCVGDELRVILDPSAPDVHLGLSVPCADANPIMAADSQSFLLSNRLYTTAELRRGGLTHTALNAVSASATFDLSGRYLAYRSSDGHACTLEPATGHTSCTTMNGNNREWPAWLLTR
jgi:hypothetical protein